MDELKVSFNFDLKNFSKKGVDLSKTFKTRYIKPPHVKINPDSLLKYENAEALARDIILQPLVRYVVILNGSFIAGDFIEALIVKNAYLVKSLDVCSLSVSENNVDSFANLLNGGFVDELNLIVSTFFYSHEKTNLVPYIYQELDKDDRFQLAVADDHRKITLIETHCGLKIVIHGSANLRSSSNIEEINIEENPILYDFYKQTSDQILKVFQTIQKPVRRKKMWDAVIGS